jgi:chemotaxis protein MotD
MTSLPPPQGERGETAIPRAPTQPGAPEGSAALPPPLPAQAVRDVQLTAARQETVLPGFTVGAPFQQAAEQIAAALSEPEAAARPAELPARPGSAPEPVRVLRIQLQPATLGSLTVQLSLRQNALALRVEASEPRTARLLEADREKLADVLRSAGYEVGALIVQPAAPDRAANPAGQTAAMPDPRGGEGGAQAQPGGSQAGARSDGGGQQGGPARHAPSAGPSEEGSHAPGSRPAGRDLYL